MPASQPSSPSRRSRRGTRRPLALALGLSPLLLAATLPGCGEWRVSEYYGGGTLRLIGALEGAPAGLVGDVEVPGISSDQMAEGVDLCEASGRGGAYLHWPISPDNVVWSIAACVPLGDDLEAAMPGGEDLEYAHITVISDWVSVELSSERAADQGGGCFYNGYNDFPSLVGGESLEQVISTGGTAPQDLLGVGCDEEEGLSSVEGGSLTVEWAFDPGEMVATKDWDEFDLNFE